MTHHKHSDLTGKPNYHFKLHRFMVGSLREKSEVHSLKLLINHHLESNVINVSWSSCSRVKTEWVDDLVIPIPMKIRWHLWDACVRDERISKTNLFFKMSQSHFSFVTDVRWKREGPSCCLRDLTRSCEGDACQLHQSQTDHEEPTCQNCWERHFYEQVTISYASVYLSIR